MLELFMVLILGMAGIFALFELYSRTIGRYFANKALKKQVHLLEEHDKESPIRIIK